jgi:small-conductance mechanosensitive channel
MRVLIHTEQQFVAEEKPLIWVALFALFLLASAILVMQVLTGAGGGHTIAAGCAFFVSAYLLFSIERVWIVLDREANIAELHSGRDRTLISIDALMGAEVRRDGPVHSLAITTAIRDVPILLNSRDRTADGLDLCAARLNAWLRGEPLPQTAATAAPALDSAPLLT